MKTKDLVLMAMYIALYIVLEKMMAIVPLFSMPNGGKLGLSVLALVLASYHLGLKKGMLVIIASLLARFVLIKPPYFISFPQLFLDYFFAYGVYGLACLFKDRELFGLELPIGVIITNILRYLFHSIAGVLYYPSGDNMSAIIKGSLLYNLPYMAATLALTFVLVTIIKPRLMRI